MFSEAEEGVTDFDERHNTRFAEDVVMLQVRNNKHKKVIPIDQLEALDVPHYPYTFVIVDMRPGNQAILVQQKSSAFKNPDEVAALVTDYCSRVLQLSS